MNFAGRLMCALWALFFVLPVVPAVGSAITPDAGGMIGSEQRYEVKENESLWEIARKFDVGIAAISDANQDVDPIIPEPGSSVRIPTAWILPEPQLREGIVINIPEFRLYYFPAGDPGTVLTFPLAVGDEGRDTPVGSYTVIEKIVNPSWHVPESIRRQRPKLPLVVPPGPDNPMGGYALRLSLKTILIHGTDRPWGIGTRSSHGCLRLFPEDIERLFAMVGKGTKVTIVNQPIKVAMLGERVFVEAHRYMDGDYAVKALRLLADKGVLERVDMGKLVAALETRTGMPVEVTRQSSESDMDRGAKGNLGPNLVHFPFGNGDEAPDPVPFRMDFLQILNPSGEAVDCDPISRRLCGIMPALPSEPRRADSKSGGK